MFFIFFLFLYLGFIISDKNIFVNRFLEKSLENWENSDWRDNEVAQEMVKTYKRLIQETDEEIAVYAQAKVTGVIITREARNRLKEIRNSKECDDSERL